MGLHCIVKGCKKFANKKLFFRVPENLTNVWYKIINREDFTPSRNSRICSDHFSPNDIVKSRFLRKGAEPKIKIIAGILYFFLFFAIKTKYTYQYAFIHTYLHFCLIIMSYFIGFWFYIWVARSLGMYNVQCTIFKL